MVLHGQPRLEVELPSEYSIRRHWLKSQDHVFKLLKSFQYGIYTTKSNINVGEIAKIYLNGGGHAGAGGGETKEFIFHKLLSN